MDDVKSTSCCNRWIPEPEISNQEVSNQKFGTFWRGTCHITIYTFTHLRMCWPMFTHIHSNISFKTILPRPISKKFWLFEYSNWPRQFVRLLCGFVDALRSGKRTSSSSSSFTVIARCVVALFDRSTKAFFFTLTLHLFIPRIITFLILVQYGTVVGTTKIAHVYTYRYDQPAKQASKQLKQLKQLKQAQTNKRRTANNCCS